MRLKENRKKRNEARERDGRKEKEEDRERKRGAEKENQRERWAEEGKRVRLRKIRER